MNKRSKISVAGINLFFILLLLATNCSEDKDPIPSYSWKFSDINPQNQFYAFTLKVCSDGNLYAFGSMNFGTERNIYQLKDDQWIKKATPDLNNGRFMEGITDMEVYQGDLYLLTLTRFLKLNDTSQETLHDFIGSENLDKLVVFNNKLILTGRKEINNRYFTASIYENGSFSGITDKVIYRIFKADDKLYILSFTDLFEYDESPNLRPVKLSGDIINIKDSRGYYREMGDVVSAWSAPLDGSGKPERLGDYFPSDIQIDILDFAGSSPVLIGSNTTTRTPVSYIYQDKKWHEVPNLLQVLSVVNYQGRLLASYFNGPIIELSAD